MYIKKSILLFVAAVAAVFFVCPSITQAQFKKDFLYKFHSRYSDIAVNSTGTRIFVINESYSRIEEYDNVGNLQAVIHGGFGITSTKFNRPQGLAMDGSDILYVLDSGNNRVARYNVSAVYPSFVAVGSPWGTGGTSAGQFANPQGIAVDGTGTYVYIADTDNNRVQKCTVDGVTCTVWGGLGTAAGKFSAPRGIFYDASQSPEMVYVADTGNNRIQWFDADGSGTQIGSFGSYGSGNGAFILPYRVTTNAAGNYIYVLDTLSRIQRLVKATGAYSAGISLTTNGGSTSTNGGGIATNTTTLYVSSFPAIYQTYSTTTLASLSGPFTSEIGRPVDMVIDGAGSFLINNNLTAPAVPVVQKFNSSFVQTGEWTGGGLGFSAPLGIGTNTNNDVYVANTGNEEIQKFDQYGTYGFSTTPAPIAFNSPRDITSENTGKFYVTDFGNGRVVKFDTDRTVIWSQLLPTVGALTPTPFGGTPPAPYGVTLDTITNDIYVADYGYHRILRYNANLLPTPGPTGTWGEYGTADGGEIPQFDKPQGMAVGPEPTAYIYVADTGNNRIQRFNQEGGEQIKWGTYGVQDGNFDQPRNVVVDSASRVYVSEVGNKRIQVFGDATGSAGLNITQAGGTVIAEGATETSPEYIIDTYTVKLNTQPSSPVLVSLTVSEATQAAVTTPFLTFTQYNWNIPQTVTVVPIHDSVANGPQHILTIAHKTASSDLKYNSPLISISDVTVYINDVIDVPGITLSTHNVSATEGVQSVSAYTITLDTKPTQDVTITLGANPAITYDTSIFTFTPTGSLTRSVTFTPVRDYVDQGASYPTYIYHTVTSADPQYAALDSLFSDNSGNVLVTVLDPDDAAGVTFSETALTVSDVGTTTATYTVRLNSMPAGSSSVTIYPTSSDTTDLTVEPSSLTFTTADWDTEQTVTATSVPDYMQAGNRAATITHPATLSTDGLYSNINLTAQNIAVTITDTDTSTLLVFKSGGGTVTVAEGGVTDTYSMQLTSKPLYDVTVAVASASGLAGVVPQSLRFDTNNWSIAQTVTVTAYNDRIAQGTHTETLTHTLTATDAADINFNGKVVNQTVSITDNDVAGITVTLPYGAVNVTEGGPSDTFSIVLQSTPTDTVTIAVDAQTQVTATPTTLTFTPSNWDTAQTVTVTAVPDYIIEGPMIATLTYTATSPTDAGYDGKTATVEVNVADNDSLSPGITINETDGSTAVSKDGNTDTYTIQLMSMPSRDVRIRIVADGPDATSSGTVFFTPAEWNTPKVITVTALTNPSGGKTTIFSHLVTSLDLHYQGVYAPTVTVIVNENRGSSSSSGPVAAPVCSKTPPYSAPNLFQVTTNQTQATIYFTPIRENISYYFVAFGFTPGDMRFGTSFQWGPYDGVIDYTVNMLTPGTKYYFMVRGGNGCATGPWSNSVAGTAVGPEYATTKTWTFYASSSSSSTSGASSGGSTGSSSSSSSSPTGGIWLTRDLFPGSQGADVRSLQEHLNARGFTLATSGPGSPGNETTYYGNLTASAVRRFQEAHFAEILSPLGYASGTGICGWSTRNYINTHP